MRRKLLAILAEISTQLWLRFPGEATRCPGCSSQRLCLLDAFPIPSTLDGRRVSFATGCEDCGLLFSNPVPTRDELDRYYSREGEWASAREDRTKWIDAKYRRRLKKRRPPKVGKRRGARDVLLEELAAHLPTQTPPPGSKVLDVGCGDGKLLDRLQALGWRTYGIEPSTTVAFLRHHGLDAPPQDGSFDFAILHHVLEHVTEPVDLLRQLARSLREGGVLFLSVPRLDTLPVHRDYRYCLNGRTHVVGFSETCLRGLLARAGLTLTARLDDRLDVVLTDGKPLRLRLVATRTETPAPFFAAPLGPARRALRAYARTGGLASRIRMLLPVRVRAALMNRAKKGRRQSG